MRRIKQTVFILLCFFSALYGMGAAYRAELTPSNLNTFRTEGFYHDGWLAADARLELPGLLFRGNRLEMVFNSWRPTGAGGAQLEIKVCGRIVSRLNVGEQQKQVAYLRGKCSPRIVEFHTLNPVRVSGDTRILGVQFKRMTVTSRFGVPLLDWKALTIAVLALICLGYLLSLVFPVQGAGLHIAVVPVVSYFFLRTAVSSNDLWNLSTLWFFCATLLTGMAVSGRMSYAEKQTGQGSLRPYLLSIIVLAGFSIRFYGIDFGLPDHYHPDEVAKVNHVLRMLASGDLNPHYFLHPSLLLYLTLINSKILTFLYPAAELRQTVILAGRLVSVLAGTFSIYLTYLIGSYLYSARTGLIAAAVLAFLPLHVTCSRYIKEDVLLTFFILASLAAILKSVKEDRRGFLFLAGLAAGLSMSVKYSGALCLLIIAAAPWIRSKSFKPDRVYLKVTAFALLMVPLGFILGTPYSVLDFSGFIKGVLYEKQHMLKGHSVAINAWSQFWMYHLRRSILPGMTFITSSFAMIAFGFILYRRRWQGLLLIGIILLFYLPAEFVKAKPAPQPERYILPVLPFLSLSAAHFVDTLWNAGRIKIALIISVMIVFSPCFRSLELASEIRADTRLKMKRFMQMHIPRGSKILVDWEVYSPDLSGEYKHVKYLERKNIFNSLTEKRLRESGYDYLILSSLFYDRYFSQPGQNAAIREIIREVFRKFPVVVEFRPRFGTYGFHNPVLTLFDLKARKIPVKSDE
ncbi:MAG: phospholipid carrier-dependent glycosyltransferase [Candidatus Dadabacteria bacterium]|nr:MAG: phospholipid carrier-dependent glycosyltransferase [Candidatus Dadabacteria bacterium]